MLPCKRNIMSEWHNQPLCLQFKIMINSLSAFLYNSNINYIAIALHWGTIHFLSTNFCVNWYIYFCLADSFLASMPRGVHTSSSNSTPCIGACALRLGTTPEAVGSGGGAGRGLRLFRLHRLYQRHRLLYDGGRGGSPT